MALVPYMYLSAQDTPTFTPDDPDGLDAPTDTPPTLDTDTLTPPSDDVVSSIPDLDDKLYAVSTRALVTSGEGAMINGFIITGSGEKTVVIRGTGPSFQSTSIPDTLEDPFLRLYQLVDGAWTELETNDDWETGLTDADRAVLTANNFAPTNALESVIVASLSAGTYGAQLEGKGSDEGAGLAEVYDFDTSSVSKITALSTRVFAGTDGNTLIGGFTIAGSAQRTVGIRAVGPSLPAAAVSDPLSDPSLLIYRFDTDSNSFVAVTGATNDDWEDLSAADQATLSANSFTPSDSNESALVLTLDPGVYGAQVTGSDGGTGTALIEVYDFTE